MLILKRSSRKRNKRKSGGSWYSISMIANSDVNSAVAKSVKFKTNGPGGDQDEDDSF